MAWLRSGMADRESLTTLSFKAGGLADFRGTAMRGLIDALGLGACTIGLTVPPIDWWGRTDWRAAMDWRGATSLRTAVV